MEAIEYAAKFGFDSVYADPSYVASLDDTGLAKVAATMKESVSSVYRWPGSTSTTVSSRSKGVGGYIVTG